MSYAISYFRDREDADLCAQQAREAAPDAPAITVDKSSHSLWVTVSIVEYIGRSAQAAIRVICRFAAAIEVKDAARARCGMVWGKWMDPQVYLTDVEIVTCPVAANRRATDAC